MEHDLLQFIQPSLFKGQLRLGSEQRYYWMILEWIHAQVFLFLVITYVNSHPGTLLRPYIRRFRMIYLCLVHSNKQQIQGTKIPKNPQKHWITGNF